MKELEKSLPMFVEASIRLPLPFQGLEQLTRDA
jgi:hypothetical protein